MDRRAHWPAFLACALLLTGCSDGPSGGYAAETGDAKVGSHTPRDQHPPRSHDTALGKAIFTENCLRCHGEGVDDAPRLGDATAWEPRLRQGLDAMIAHAIEGHGRMPPKGGFHALSDTQVAAAVAYVADESKKIILARRRAQLASECHPLRAPEKCSNLDAEEVLTLHMLWLLGAPGKR
jgi:cytochrome c5